MRFKLIILITINIFVIILCVIYRNPSKKEIIQNKKNIQIEKKNLKIGKFLLERSPYKDVYQLTIISDNADMHIIVFLTNHDVKYLKAFFNKKIK